jgi:hypothetical protein
MATFQGSPLDHEIAWKIMEGHWIESPCSWRPVLGQNPAYDYFPSQYNSWYRDPKGNRGWYDPVFKVITLDGREVWRKRHLAPVHPSRIVQMDWFQDFQEVSSDPGGRFELDQCWICWMFGRFSFVKIVSTHFHSVRCSGYVSAGLNRVKLGKLLQLWANATGFVNCNISFEGLRRVPTLAICSLHFIP